MEEKVSSIKNLQSGSAPTSIEKTEVEPQASPENLSGLSRSLSPSRIPELDGLRGLAILMVVVYHYVGTGPSGPPGSMVTSVRRFCGLGWSGVDLFFVLSGFLIGGILLDARDSPHYFRTFYLRRVHRILPIYYVFVVAFAAAAFFSNGHMPPPLVLSPLAPRFLPVYLLFLQNIFPQLGTIFTHQWLAPLWSLAVEEQFYLVVPLLIRYLPRRLLVWVLILAMGGAPATRYVLLHLGHPGAMYAWTLSRADALSIGVLAAMLWRSPGLLDWLRAHFAHVRIALAVLFSMTLYFAFLHADMETMIMALVGFSCLALFYSSLLLTVLLKPAGVLARCMRHRGLQEFGTISYCMYLIHTPINPLVHWTARHAWAGVRTLPEILVTILSFLTTWGVCRISWRFLEKPLIRRGREYSY